MTIILQNSLLRMVFGEDAGIIHPGILIRGFILALLIDAFVKDLIQTRAPKTWFVWSIILFLVFICAQLLIIEVGQFRFVYLTANLIFSSKVLLYLLIAYYVYKNTDYFNDRLDKILLFNAVFVLINIIIGYYFQIGFKSYERIEDSYRGFLAGNDSSIFTFVTFGYALYTIEKDRIKSILILLGSLVAMFIIATKSFVICGVILVFYLIHKKKLVYALVPMLIIGLIGGWVIMSNLEMFEGRMLSAYSASLSQAERMLETKAFKDSFIIKIASNFAPVRIVNALSLFFQIINDDWKFLLFGYGPGGVYEKFGRPPMMDLFKLIAFYGFAGFFIIFSPLLIIMKKLVFGWHFDLVGIIFLAMLAYGSLGGFLFGVANTSSIFALFFGLALSKFDK